MTWLRIHDGFTAHPKIAQLSDKDFRVWMRLLCYTGNARDPSVDSVTKREVSGLTSARVSRFTEIGLLDPIGDGFEVHNWSKYLPKEEQNAARQAKWRARRRNAQSNVDGNGTSNDDVGASGNASPSRTRAGTRGVPSRPVVQDQDQPLPEPEPSLEATRANGRGSGTGSDEPELIAGETARQLERLRGEA